MRRSGLGVVLAAVGSAALAAPSPPVSGQASTGDIVVTGTRSRPSSWREAETAHVVILSDGSEAELVRLATNVERLHRLLAGLMGRADAPDDTVKLRVTMIGDVPEFQALDLRNLRWQQGPFNDLFTLTRFYDPRSDGAVMATTRVDQQVVIEHTTNTPAQVLSTLQALGGSAGGAPAPGSAAGGNPADAAALQSALVGDFTVVGMRGPRDLTVESNERSIPVTAESLFYAGYAQHYLLTYFPAAYPRWYLDGFAQIFASLVVKSDNVVEFGRSPRGTSAVLNEFGPFPIADVLNDRYLEQRPHKTGWTPIHAWLLTHFLFFSDIRRPQLRQYLTQRANGVDAATAAQVFGDLKQLARELRTYYGARKPYEQVTLVASADADRPVVRRLTQGQAAFVKGRLELGARVAIPSAAPDGVSPDAARSIDRARAEALKKREQWLARLQGDAEKYRADLDAQLLLAEAACRSDHAGSCRDAADWAAALAPGDTRAMTWQGMAAVLAAAEGPAGARAAALAAGRRLIVAANRRDPDAVEPLLAFYQSFIAAHQEPPVAAIDGLQKAMEEVPAAPATRLELATALATRGRDDAARRVILPVAIGAYDSPERPAARALLARLGGTATAPNTAGR